MTLSPALILSIMFGHIPGANGLKNRLSSGKSTKRIAFIRHGCTYMNEYLAESPYGSPGFTDVFPEHKKHQYHDTPLSPRGEKQARNLSLRLASSQPHKEFVKNVDLVVCSPLTRALQTLELGLLPHLSEKPIVAHPLAGERLYLVSDIGKPTSQLHESYGHFVDFHHAFDLDGDILEDWWFCADDDTYEEWRPIGNGQRYACPGEPDDHFENRMISFYEWLGARPESTVAVVCHHGVIDWFLDEDFDNCQMKVVPFHEISPRSLSRKKTGR